MMELGHGAAALVCAALGLVGFVLGLVLSRTSSRLAREEAATSGRRAPASFRTVLDRRPYAAGLVLAVVFLAIFLEFGLQWRCLELLILASILFLAALVDLEVFLIPNGLILVGIAVRTAFVVLYGATGAEARLPLIVGSLAGGLSISLPVLLLVLVMDKLLGRPSMGGGDVKLLFMTGLYLPWELDLLALLISCFVAIIYALIASRFAIGAVGDAGCDEESGSVREAMRERESGSEEEAKLDGEEEPRSSGPSQVRIPFGVPIAIAFWLVMVFGDLAVPFVF